MLELRDLFQWERFITPSIIKPFYWLVVILCVLGGIAGILGGLAAMFVSPITGLVSVVMSLVGMLIGVITARIIAEYILIMFRINEHLGAIRNRGGM